MAFPEPQHPPEDPDDFPPPAVAAQALNETLLTNPLDWRTHPIRQYPDMSLRVRCRAVDERTFAFARTLGRRMEAMVDAAGALGLAAPQVGFGLRIFSYMREDETIHTAINPVLENGGPIELGGEGCLSLGQLGVDVWRPRDTRMRALDLDGEECVYEGSELWARVLQHEADHLDGRLIIDIGVDVPLLSMVPYDPLLGFMARRPLLKPLGERVYELLARAREADEDGEDDLCAEELDGAED